MMPYFTFKGVESTPYLIVNRLPDIIKPKADVDVYEIEGRDGFLTHNKGTYRGYIKKVECSLKNLCHIDYITSWLDGSGDLILSNEPEKIYKATVINQIDIGRISRIFYSFIVIFEVQPFKYINVQNVVLTEPGTIHNPGTCPSLPLIKVTGTGNVTLTINGVDIELSDVSPEIIIDSDLLDCYRGTTNLNNQMVGKFPSLKVGENTISWTGNVTQVEIEPRWRYI